LVCWGILHRRLLLLQLLRHGLILNRQLLQHLLPQPLLLLLGVLLHCRLLQLLLPQPPLLLLLLLLLLLDHRLLQLLQPQLLSQLLPPGPRRAPMFPTNQS
jgi:hypothetical protein